MYTPSLTTGRQRVVAVGQRVRNGELFKTGSARGLNDANVGNIVRNQSVKADLQCILIVACVMRSEDLRRNRFLTGGICIAVTVSGAGCAVAQKHAGIVQSHCIHKRSLRGKNELKLLYHVLQERSIASCKFAACARKFFDAVLTVFSIRDIM